jgi:enolase
MAVAKASANSSVLPLFLYLREFIKKEDVPAKIPTPLFNIFNGGKHAGDNVNFQEYMIIPATSKTYSQSLMMGTTIYHQLKNILREKGLSTLVGDEGGYAPICSSNKEPLGLIAQAINASTLRLGLDVFLGIDAAATSFYENKEYHMVESSSPLSSDDLISYYEKLDQQSNILYLEDPLAEDDWDGWASISGRLSKDTMVVGDDLTATNPYRLQMALDKKAITGIIIKPNQIGTVTETLAVVEIAKHAGLKTIVSHRSGETNDDFIADFATAVSADYVKFGAPARGERVAKYNRLLQIEKSLHVL